MLNAPASSAVRIRDDGTVTEVMFDQPAARNALTSEALTQLRAFVDSIESSRVVVFTGADGAFTSGGDRGEVMAVGTFDEQVTVLREKSRLVEQIRQLDTVTIAAINGPCAGLGVGLAAACTLRFASSVAFVDTAYLRLGLSGDFGAAYLLAQLVGPGAAADWMLRPRRIPAEELRISGFSQGTFPDSSFRDDIARVAREISATSSAARRSIVQNLREARDLPLATALDLETRRHVAAKSLAFGGNQLANPEGGNHVTEQ